MFDGDGTKCELFEIKFLGHLRLQKLFFELDTVIPDVEKNACIFAELAMVPDDKSLSLIIRDAKDDDKRYLSHAEKALSWKEQTKDYNPV